MGLSRGCYEAEMVNHSFNIQQIHTEYLLCVGCILDTGPENSIDAENTKMKAG